VLGDGMRAHARARLTAPPLAAVSCVHGANARRPRRSMACQRSSSAAWCLAGSSYAMTGPWQTTTSSSRARWSCYCGSGATGCVSAAAARSWRSHEHAA
jgi:hypothetical protein